jgi:hypothetical protein
MSVANKPAVIGAFDREIIRPQDEVEKPVKKPIASPFPMIPLRDIRLPQGGAWLVKEMVPRTGVGIIFGASQTYKSFILLSLLMAIAAKQDRWGGALIKSHGAVVYICAEGGGGIRNRIMALRQQLGIGLDVDLPFYLIERRPRLGVDKGDTASLIAEIKRQLPEGMPVAAVAVDTLSQCLGGGEENGSGAQMFMANMTEIAQAFGCVSIAVHHTGRSDDERTRGHSSLDGNPDFQWLVKRSDQSMTSRVTLKKIKDGKHVDAAFDVRLAVADLGTDEDGDEITSLVVDEITEAATEGDPKGSNKLNPKQQAFMDLMDRVANDGHKQVTRFEIDGPMLDAVPNEMVRKLWIEERALPDEKNAIANAERAYNRVRGELVDKGLIRIKGHGKEGMIGWM